MKPRHDHIATQVGARRRRRPGHGAGEAAADRVIGSTSRRRGRRRRRGRGLGAAASELLPDGVQPVAGPSDTARQPCWARTGADAPPAPAAADPGVDVERDRQRRAGVVLHPAQQRAGRAASTLPKTATVRPPCAALGRASRCRGAAWCTAWTTASASSSGPVLRSASRKCQALPGSSPVAVTSRTVKPRWLRWTAIDAAAETAASREEAMPWPRCARSRLSRKSVARDCQGCSSRRTISSPTRAELRQCTRRRSSPRRYSRTVTSSALPVANARGRLSPEPGPRAAERDGGQRHRARGDGERHGGAERAAELDQAERVADPHRHRADLEAAAHVGAHLVGHVPAPAVADALEHEARAGAEHVGDLVLEQQHAARGAALVGEGEVDPGRLAGRDQLRGDRAHQREPVAAAPEQAAVTSGSASTSTPTRVSASWPSTIGADDRGDARGQERPSADGQTGECLTHGSPRAPGHGPATMPSRIAVVERPLIAASTLGSRRCASTGRARVWTSSGST